uniref:Uncharacterized protein n=1 Tax=Anopheles farauti TaxID=69004 RepID=A0A182QVQ8_9DIPT
MADLEAVLADVSYLMAMEKSKCMPAARASKKIVLPDPRFSRKLRKENSYRMEPNGKRNKPSQNYPRLRCGHLVIALGGEINHKSQYPILMRTIHFGWWKRARELTSSFPPLDNGEL